MFTVAACVLCSSGCHADPVSFNFVDTTLQFNSTVTGSVVIDTTTGLFENIDVSISTGSNSTNPASTYVFDGAPFYQAPTSLGFGYGAGYADPTDGADFYVVVPDTSLVGYAGGELCTINAPCGSVSGLSPAGQPFLAETGSLVASTPEPTTFALLSTGLLGAAALGRKRWKERNRILNV